MAVRFETGGVVRARATALIASRVMAPIVAGARPAGRSRARGRPAGHARCAGSRRQRARAGGRHDGALESARAAEAEVASGRRRARARARHARSHRARCTPSDRPPRRSSIRRSPRWRQPRRTRASARRALAAAAAARDAAQAAAEGAARRRQRTPSLAAPFDGVVTERHVDPGSMAAPGVPLLTVEDPAAYRLEVRVDEARAARRRRQDRRCRVQLDGAPTTAADRPARRRDRARRSGVAQLSRQDRPAAGSAGALGRVRPGPLQRPGAAGAGGSGVGRRPARPAHVRLRRRTPTDARGCGRVDWRRRRRPRSRCSPGLRRAANASSSSPPASLRTATRVARRAADDARPTGVAGRLAAAFIHSKLTPLVIVASLLLGVVRRRRAAARGGAADHRADDRRLRRRCRARRPRRSSSASRGRSRSCSGKSRASSTSTRRRAPAASMVVVRFLVGEDEERALVRLNQKLAANAGRCCRRARRRRSSSRARSTTCRSWR